MVKVNLYKWHIIQTTKVRMPYTSARDFVLFKHSNTYIIIIYINKISSRVQVGNNVIYTARVRDEAVVWALRVKGKTDCKHNII